MTSKARACKARTASGKPCDAPASASGFCWIHDPARGAERAAARRAGGRARHTPHSDSPRPASDVRTVDDVRGLLSYALAECLEGDNSIARGRLLVAIAGAFLEAFKVGEFEQRLAALEAQLKVT